jgi:hypothetical protein
MNTQRKSLLFIKLITIVLSAFFFCSSVDAADQIITGELEAYTQRNVKVDGWYYFLCQDMKEAEHEGIWVLNKKGEEIGYENIDSALEVKIHINKEKNCVWKIKVLKFSQ